jgi:putative pyruvate formate lyase activating enzyme
MPNAIDDFIVGQFTPAYLAPGCRGGLAGRVEEAVASLQCCRTCPRRCEVNRLANHTKVCRTGRHARVSSAFPHLGEEDCLRGSHGSGTIFFSWCNLRCVFCQNWDISQSDAGYECPADQIAALMLRLQGHGCHNINFVTPEHVAPQVIEATAIAIERGLNLPIVYNTSAYDSLQSLRQLDGLIDIYMPDFKLFSAERCARYLGAGDYAERAREAISEMHRQVGPLRFTGDGLACRGVLVRHLVMPGLLDESARIFRWLAEQVSRDTYVNIMAQYHPAHLVVAKGKDAEQRYEEINRRPTPREMSQAHRLALEAGLWRFDQRR